MTDEHDRDLLLIILKTYLTPEIFSDTYTYSNNTAYKYPGDGDIMHFQHFMHELPINDIPELFGLH